MDQSIDDLRRRLQANLGKFGKEAESWLDVRAMERERKAIEKRHETVNVFPDVKTVEHYVRLYRKNGRFESHRHLRYVCFGLASSFGGWSVLGSARHLMGVLARTSAEDRPNRRRRCFQGLLASYFSHRPESPDDPCRSGWLELRRWLKANLDPLMSSLGRVPDWILTLSEHRNLLEDNPCGRYGNSLLRGNAGAFAQTLARMAVPSVSWVREEAVLAQVIASTKFDDSVFHSVLPDVLTLLRGGREFPISTMLQRAGVARLVSRYAESRSLPEHDGLRDSAVSIIGNPWLMRTEWDAYVVDGSGDPDTRARMLVDGWLKRRLISDFFMLLNADGSTDSRRLAYWLRFEPLISDMWFVLGENAVTGNGASLVDFRKRANGRLLGLSAASPRSNAFIMRVGQHLIVEVGETKNACYVYRWSVLPKAVERALSSSAGDIELPDLKSTDFAQERMLHMDSPRQVKSWEQKFDQLLRGMLSASIPGRAACIPELEDLLVRRGLKSEDLRPKGGNLWVFAGSSDRELKTKLLELGFQHKTDKGWWISERD
jgi:hypothetical protein